MTEYNLNRPWETLDDWQKEYIQASGNCFLLCGRQCGKSTAASIKTGELAVQKAKQDILIIAFTEKQAYELFFKVLNYLELKYPQFIKKGREKPTKHEIRLKNGSIIRCHACGQTGSGLRGYTCTKIIVDEAAPMSKEIFTAITPMLSVTGGTIDLLSTPKSKSGYFYEASLREDYAKFYVSAENCPRHAKGFLEQEKAHMSDLEYAQEYLAVFLDDLRRIFSDDLLKVCAVLKRVAIRPEHTYYLGCDVARMGEDETTFEILDKIDSDNIKQVENLITSKQLLTQTAEKILDLEKLYSFREIGIDDAGVGAGLFDILLRESSTRRKIVGLNNSAKPLDLDDKKKRRILKEDMYMNLLQLLQRGKLKLLDDDELVLSLKSVQYEYVQKEGRETRMRIFGSNTHIAEGLIRAAYLITLKKHLNIWVR